jgi:hypothetical protein
MIPTRIKLIKGATFPSKFNIGDEVVRLLNTITHTLAPVGTIIDYDFNFSTNQYIYAVMWPNRPMDIVDESLLILPKSVVNCSTGSQNLNTKKCECGAIKSKSTHANWCDLFGV